MSLHSAGRSIAVFRRRQKGPQRLAGRYTARALPYPAMKPKPAPETTNRRATRRKGLRQPCGLVLPDQTTRRVPIGRK